MKSHFQRAAATLSAVLILTLAAGAHAIDLPLPPSLRIEEIDLREAPLRDALSLIGEQAGINLAASDEASKTKVTLRLRNITSLGAVQAICQTHGLFFNRKIGEEGIDIVTTVKEFQEGLTVFREEKTEVFTLLYPNAVDLAIAIRDVFGTRVRLSLGKDGVYDESDEVQRRFDRFDLIDERSQGLSNSFNGSGSSSSSGGGGGGQSSSGGSRRSGGGGRGGSGGNLTLVPPADVQTNIPRQNEFQNMTNDQMQRIAELRRQSDAGVGLDAEKLAAIGRNNNSVVYVSVLNRNNQVIVRTSDPGVLEEINRIKARIDVPTPQVLLEVKVLSVDLTDGFRSIFDVQFGDNHNTTGFSTGNILPPPSALAPALTIGGTGGGQPFNLTPSSLVYQWVNDNFRARMQLLENTNRVTALATPMLLVANNEVSRVFIGQERPIVRNIGSQATVNSNVVTNNQTTEIEFRPVGTTLLITPNINSDRTVTLRILQETSAVIPNGATIPVVNGSGGVTNQPVDVVAARTLTGTMIAKDGLTLALGGLIEEGSQGTREAVPVLGRLPVVGVPFRRQVTGRFRREVVIVIRPFILSTPGEAEEAGKRLTDANIIHPLQVNPPPYEPIGSMNTYFPHEVVKPKTECGKLEKIFHFHEVTPSDF